MSSIKEVLDEMTGGDPDFFKELAEAYVINFEEFGEAGTAALQTDDIEAFRREFHKIKPSAISLQMDDLMEKLDPVHSPLAEPEKSEALNLIRTTCERAVQELKGIM